jgi:hypothetical protein
MIINYEYTQTFCRGLFQGTEPEFDREGRGNLGRPYSE